MFDRLQKTKIYIPVALLIFYASCKCNSEKVVESVYVSFDPKKEAPVDKALTTYLFKSYSDVRGGAIWHAYDSVVLTAFGTDDLKDTLLTVPLKGLYTLQNKKSLVKIFATAPTRFNCEACQPLISIAVLKQVGTDQYVKQGHYFLSSSGAKGKIGNYEARLSGDSMLYISLPGLQGVNEWSYHYKAGLKHLKQSY